jgi:hypothetical protein
MLRLGDNLHYAADLRRTRILHEYMAAGARRMRL